MADANPTPIPPKIRYKLNIINKPTLEFPESKNKNSGYPDNNDEMIKSIAATCNYFLRPK